MRSAGHTLGRGPPAFVSVCTPRLYGYECARSSSVSGREGRRCVPSLFWAVMAVCRCSGPGQPPTVSAMCRSWCMVPSRLQAQCRVGEPCRWPATVQCVEAPPSLCPPLCLCLSFACRVGRVERCRVHWRCPVLRTGKVPPLPTACSPLRARCGDLFKGFVELSAEYHQSTTSLAHKGIVLNKLIYGASRTRKLWPSHRLRDDDRTVRTPPPSRAQVQPHGCSPAAAPPSRPPPSPDTGE